MPESDQDRYRQPTMSEAVFEYTLIRRKIGNPVLFAKNPETVADWLRKLWRNTPSDEMMVIAINNENQVVGYQYILGGPGHPTFGNMEYGLDAVFRPIIQLGMKRFIIAIHQSENLKPIVDGIDEMVRFTGRIADMLHLDFLDLMIVAQDEWVSARMSSHGPALHALAHSIIEDLGGGPEDHARLDEKDPEDMKWTVEVLTALGDTVPTEVLERVIERLEPIVDALNGGDVPGGVPGSRHHESKPEDKLPEGFLSIEDLMRRPEASDPTIASEPLLDDEEQS